MAACKRLKEISVNMNALRIEALDTTWRFWSMKGSSHEEDG
jgi:hypothetical protein